MSRYVLTEPARDDLTAIWDYVAERDGFDRADHVAHSIRDAIMKLADMPGMGHLREELADESLRVWSVFSYLVVYRSESTPLQVIRILHGARDLMAMFDK